MSPAFALEDETVALLLYVEGRTKKMRLAEGTTDFKFLADGECLLSTHNLEAPDATALASI